MEARNMIHLCLTFLLCLFISIGYASTPGAFIGMGLGYTEIDTPDNNVFGIAFPAMGDTVTHVTKTENEVGGLGGLIYAGYNFSPYFGVEASYNHYASSDYATEQCSGTLLTCATAAGEADIKFQTSTINLVAKAYLPLNAGFELNGRAGLAYVYQKKEYDNSSNDPTFIIPTNGEIATPDLGSETLHRIRPTLGLGIGYLFNENISLDFAWNMVLGNDSISSDKDAIPNLHMFTLNLTYNFA